MAPRAGRWCSGGPAPGGLRPGAVAGDISLDAGRPYPQPEALDLGIPEAPLSRARLRRIDGPLGKGNHRHGPVSRTPCFPNSTREARERKEAGTNRKLAEMRIGRFQGVRNAADTLGKAKLQTPGEGFCGRDARLPLPPGEGWERKSRQTPLTARCAWRPSPALRASLSRRERDGERERDGVRGPVEPSRAHVRALRSLRG